MNKVVLGQTPSFKVQVLSHPEILFEAKRSSAVYIFDDAGSNG